MSNKKKDVARHEKPNRTCLESLSITESFTNSNILCRHQTESQNCCSCNEMCIRYHKYVNCAEKGRCLFDLQRPEDARGKSPTLDENPGKSPGRVTKGNDAAQKNDINSTPDEGVCPVLHSSCNIKTTSKDRSRFVETDKRDASTSTPDNEIIPCTNPSSNQAYQSCKSFCIPTPIQVPSVNINLPISLIPLQGPSFPSNISGVQEFRTAQDTTTNSSPDAPCPACSRTRELKATENFLKQVTNKDESSALKPAKATVADGNKDVATPENDTEKTYSLKHSADEKYKEYTKDLLTPENEETYSPKHGPKLKEKENNAGLKLRSKPSDVNTGVGSRASEIRRSFDINEQVCCRKGSLCRSCTALLHQKPNRTCICRFPPAFNQFGCTGNITGNCNCRND